MGHRAPLMLLSSQTVVFPMSCFDSGSSGFALFPLTQIHRGVEEGDSVILSRKRLAITRWRQCFENKKALL
ncbi:hypothetical protein LZ32DRAFT_606998 [Colletotrichum eremochloae]|nr:hypothetical protein LZ32DRAFT_606998 [Colletotrichum eremochloae]